VEQLWPGGHRRIIGVEVTEERDAAGGELINARKRTPGGWCTYGIECGARRRSAGRWSPGLGAPNKLLPVPVACVRVRAALTLLLHATARVSYSTTISGGAGYGNNPACTVLRT